MIEFDIIVLVKPALVDLALKLTIPRIQKHIKYRDLIIITNESSTTRFKSKYPNTIVEDEERIFNGLSVSILEQYLENRIGNSKEAGWYFQQFVKLEISKRHHLTDDYLVWDADSVPIRDLDFYDQDERILINKSNEHHPPYFELMQEVIGLEKKVNFSFISEHMVFSKDLVSELIDRISQKAKSDWWIHVMDNISDHNLRPGTAGFSEYETYGNFAFSVDSSRFRFRSIPTYRNGTRLVGLKPNMLHLKFLSFKFHYVTFETWQSKSWLNSYFHIVLRLSFDWLTSRITSKKA